jgi:hypothetical protein
MKANDVLVEKKLETHDIGMGLYQMANDELALVGGMRSGNSSAGYTRLKFMIYDLRGWEGGQMPAEEQEAREAGFVELFVKDGTQTAEGLVNIELKTNFRRGGTGRLVIQSLKDTYGELKIYDIKQKAVPFWRKMGATFYGDSHFTKPLKKTSTPLFDKIKIYPLAA